MVDFSRLAGRIGRLLGKSNIASYQATPGIDQWFTGAIIERHPANLYESLDGLPSSDTIDNSTVEIHLPLGNRVLVKNDRVVLYDLDPAGVAHRVTRGPDVTQDGFSRYGLTELIT